MRHAPHRPLRRASCWSAATLLAACILLFAIALVWSVVWMPRLPSGRLLVAGAGYGTVTVGTLAPGSGQYTSNETLQINRTRGPFRWLPELRRTPPVLAIFIPLWIPATLAAGTLIALRLTRSKPQEGHCPTCNYNLEGLITPTCPECGRTNMPAGHESPGPD